MPIPVFVYTVGNTLVDYWKHIFLGFGFMTAAAWWGYGFKITVYTVHVQEDEGKYDMLAINYIKRPCSFLLRHTS